MMPPELREALRGSAEGLRSVGLSEIATELELCLNRPTPPNTSMRDCACRLAKTDPAAAAELAASIPDPWFRCQAYAATAERASSADQQEAWLEAAFAAAWEQAEPNRIVSVASWPLKVLSLAGEHMAAEQWARRMLDTIAAEPSPVRRARALEHMLDALEAGPVDLWRETMEHFVAACLTPLLGGKKNKRGLSNLAWQLPNIARRDPRRASQLLTHIRGPVLRSRTDARLKSQCDVSGTDVEHRR